MIAVYCRVSSLLLAFVHLYCDWTKDNKMNIKKVAAIAALATLPSFASAQEMSFEPLISLIPSELVTGITGMVLSQLPLAGDVLPLVSPLTDPLSENLALVNTISSTLMGEGALAGLNLSQNDGLPALQSPLILIIDTLNTGLVEQLPLASLPAVPF